MSSAKRSPFPHERLLALILGSGHLIETLTLGRSPRGLGILCCLDELVVQQCRLGRILGLSGKPDFTCRKLIATPKQCFGATARILPERSLDNAGMLSDPLEVGSQSGTESL